MIIDVFKNYEALEKEKKEGIDYIIETRDNSS
jgi:hypothetical protein